MNVLNRTKEELNRKKKIMCKGLKTYFLFSFTGRTFGLKKIKRYKLLTKPANYHSLELKSGKIGHKFIIVGPREFNCRISSELATLLVSGQGFTPIGL
jgi:hypothetical protein